MQIQLSRMVSILNKMDDNSASDDSQLPLEKVPECWWNQDERMSALFSPFRSKSANSQDWNSKYKFWHNLIYEWLKHTVQCSFSLIDLNEVFKRNGCVPLCLVTVVEELVRYCILCYRNIHLTFLYRYEMEYDKLWNNYVQSTAKTLFEVKINIEPTVNVLFNERKKLMFPLDCYMFLEIF